MAGPALRPSAGADSNVIAAEAPAPPFRTQPKTPGAECPTDPFSFRLGWGRIDGRAIAVSAGSGLRRRARPTIRTARPQIRCPRSRRCLGASLRLAGALAAKSSSHTIEDVTNPQPRTVGGAGRAPGRLAPARADAGGSAADQAF